MVLYTCDQTTTGFQILHQITATLGSQPSFVSILYILIIVQNTFI